MPRHEAVSFMACPVCLHNCRDPRLLPCLHSVCRYCIDQIFVTAGSGDSEREISCPVCRASCCLPDCGAAALPRDTTSLATDDGTCDICQLEAAGDAAENSVVAMCNTCHVTLCKGHLLKHMMSSPSVHHSIDMLPLSFSEKPSNARSPSAATNMDCRLCTEHAQPLMYFCTGCDVFVCGGCTAVGKHAGHKPVLHAAEVAQKTKEKADVHVQKLSSDVKPRLEQALHAVDQVTTQLTTNADQVRDNIRSATQRAVHAVQACGEQLLQQVDDIETARHKVLDEQRDSLTTHLNAVNNALQFNTRLKQYQDPEEHVELLAALEHRAANLATTHVEVQPCRHTNLQFLLSADDVLMDNAKEAVGKVMPCQVSASHCSFEQTPQKIIPKEEEAAFVLQTADSHGQRLTSGGDHITSNWSRTPIGVTDQAATVEDKKNSTYEVRVIPSTFGEYKLQSKINSQNIPQPILFTYTIHLFDENECSPNMYLSADKRTVTHGHYNNNWASVLGTVGMQHGRHSWLIRVTESKRNRCACVGIASKPLPDQGWNPGSSQSFRTDGVAIYNTDGAQATSEIDAVECGDTLRLVLDCDVRTLQVTNLCSKESARITNLPIKEYFLYVNICGKGGSMELL